MFSPQACARAYGVHMLISWYTCTTTCGRGGGCNSFERMGKNKGAKNCIRKMMEQITSKKSLVHTRPNMLNRKPNTASTKSTTPKHGGKG